MPSPNTTTYHLEGDDLARVITLCASHGLAVHAATRRGVLLELSPDSLDDLPPADTLREIADALGGDGVRYVSLLIGSRDPS
jgi:hypothetical protein